MPPKAKKPAAGLGLKKRARPTRATSKVQQQPPDEPFQADRVKVAEDNTAVILKEEVKIEEKTQAIEQKSSPAMFQEEQEKVEQQSEAGGPPYKEEYEPIESVDEYEKGERLDLEDNDPEYETEEYGGVDYDERGSEQEEEQEEGDEIEEHEEEYICDDGEDDMVEEEVEGDVNEDLEGEEDDGQGGEEHADMVDAAEEAEHHEIVKERRKRKEFEIFIGGLDRGATEDDLKKVFSQVGDVTEVRLMMNSQTKKNKGFAFLRFATVEQAKRACTELKNPVVNGKPCGVTPSRDSDTLFLGNICKTWTQEALNQKLKQYGIENIDDLILVEDTNSVGMNRGFAFLEFSSRSDAMDAFKRLQKRDVIFGVDRPAKVSFADSFIDPSDEIMAKVKTVFVDGLSAHWDDAHINDLLKKYGKIEKIELACNMPSAKRKDFGFITFDSHDAAVTCAKSINNAVLGDSDDKVKVRARLSRPLSRSRGTYGSRGDVRPRHRPAQVPRAPWGRSLPHNLPVRRARDGTRVPPFVDRTFKRSAGYRERRAAIAVPPRGRPVAPLPSRSYERRPPAPAYPRSSSKRDYGSRAAIEFSPRVPSDRRTSYRDEYSSPGSGYTDFSRGKSRTAVRRTYIDDVYEQSFERPPPVYRDNRAREYDSMSGSKRAYTAMDDVPPRYVEAGFRHSHARLDYEFGGRSASQYEGSYGNSRTGRPSLGYSGSRRSSLSSQDSHGLYSSRQGMGYDRGSYGGSEAGGMYASGYRSDYVSHGSDMGGSSYSSLYSNRDLGDGGYMGSGGSRSYY